MRSACASSPHPYLLPTDTHLLGQATPPEPCSAASAGGSREERLQALRKVRARGALAPPAALPAALLEGLVWCVTEPVARARLDPAAACLLPSPG